MLESLIGLLGAIVLAMPAAAQEQIARLKIG
jgi:hypothetical protein